MRRVRWSAWMVAFACLVGLGTAVSRADEHHAKPISAPAPEFEQIKHLVGRWKGISQMGSGEGEPAAVEYKLTSGGSAIVETLFPGTPHEMVSVYHTRRGKLSMTHYCMLGNQPRLDLVKASKGRLEFSMADDSGIDSATDLHMHTLTMTWTDPDHLTQVWTSFEGGAAKDSTTITLSRVQ